MTTPTPLHSPIRNVKSQKIEKSEKKQGKKPTFWQILVSVLGALVGVQSSRVQQRDFEQGHSWWVYGIVWLILVILLILGLIVLTKWMIVSSGT